MSDQTQDVGARCRRHCWHSATPACEVCCHCGRGRNPKGGASRKVRWAPTPHGRWYIGRHVQWQTSPGLTSVWYADHPTGLRLDSLNAAIIGHHGDTHSEASGNG